MKGLRRSRWVPSSLSVLFSVALVIGIVNGVPTTPGTIKPNTLALPDGRQVPIQKADWTTFNNYQPGELWAGGSPVEACAACDMSTVSGSPGGQSVQPDQDIDPSTGDFTTGDDLFTASGTDASMGVDLTYSSQLAQYQWQNGLIDPNSYWGMGWQSSANASFTGGNGSPITVNEENGSEVTFTPVNAGTNCPLGDYQNSAKYTVPLPVSNDDFCAPYRVDAQLGQYSFFTEFDEQGEQKQLDFDQLGRIDCDGSPIHECGVVYNWNATPTNSPTTCPSSLPSGTVTNCTILTDEFSARVTSIELGDPTGAPSGITSDVLGVTDPLGNQYNRYWTSIGGSLQVSSMTTPTQLWSYGYTNTTNQYGQDMTSVENQDSDTIHVGYNSVGMATSETDPANQYTTSYSYLNTSCGDCVGDGQNQLTTVAYRDGETDIDDYFEGLLTGDSFGSTNTADPEFETVSYNYNYPVPDSAHQDDPIYEVIIHPGAAQSVEQTHITTDAVGNILSVTDANGNTTTNFYNDSGGNNFDEVCWSAPPGAALPAQTCSPSSPPPAVTSWQYDAYGDVVSETDPLGDTTHYGYYTVSGGSGVSDSQDLCWVALPTVNATSGQPCVTSPSGAAPTGSSAYGYDTYNDINTKYVDFGDSEQTTSTAVFDAANDLTSSYPPDAYNTGTSPGSPQVAYESIYSYFPQNLLASSIVPGPDGDLTTSYTYEPATQQVATEQDATGDTTNAYDGDGRMCWTYRGTTLPTASCTSPPTGGSLTKYQFLDDTDAQTEVTDPNGKTTTSVYGDIAYPTSPTEVEDPMNAAIVYNTYDADGNTCVTGPISEASCIWTSGDTYTTYDGLGNTLSSEDADGDTTDYSYGDTDYPTLMTSSMDPLGRTTRDSYDADGRPTEVSGPAGNSTDTTTTGYDADGRVCWQAIDSVGTCAAPPTGTGASTFSYDNDGNQVQMVDNKGNTSAPLQATSTYTFDNDGKLTSATDDDGNAVAYTYDDASDVTCIAYPVLAKHNCASAPGAKNSVVDYGYDASGQFISTKEWLGNKTTYAYSTDGLSNVTKITYPNNGTAETVKYGYDPDSNLTSADYAGPVTITGSSNQSWSYNADELVSATSQIGGFSSSPTYDEPQQHTWVSTATNPATPTGPDSYGYNPNGEIASDLPTGTGKSAITYGYDNAAELTSQANPNTSTTDTYAYTPDGQRCWSEATDVASPSCAAPPTGATSYAWNAFGQLCWSGQTTSTNSCSSAPSGTTTYTYDGKGQRMTETPSGGTTEDFTWDTVSGGGTPLLLDDGTNAYIYGPLLFGGAAPVEQISGSSETYLASTPSGVQLAFSQSKVNLNQSSYSTYGAQTNTASSTASSFGFQGGFTDAASGLIYFDNRYYDPSTDQFMSVDPSIAQTGEAYAFTNDDPLNGTDPLGLGGGVTRTAGYGACHGRGGSSSKRCKTYMRNHRGRNLIHLVAKHWRGIAKVGVAIGGVVAGVACGATVVCGVVVGAAASAAFYSAGTAGTEDFSATGVVESAALGGALGGIGSAGTAVVESGAEDISSLADSGAMDALAHPIASAGTLATGAGKVVGGSALLTASYAGILSSMWADRS